MHEDRFRGYLTDFGRPRIDPDLTKRELGVLSYLSRGLTPHQVADALGIGYETVRSHSKRAQFKLAAKNAAHACCQAIRLGLIR